MFKEWRFSGSREENFFQFLKIDAESKWLKECFCSWFRLKWMRIGSHSYVIHDIHAYFMPTSLLQEVKWNRIEVVKVKRNEMEREEWTILKLKIAFCCFKLLQESRRRMIPSLILRTMKCFEIVSLSYIWYTSLYKSFIYILA